MREVIILCIVLMTLGCKEIVQVNELPSSGGQLEGYLSPQAYGAVADDERPDAVAFQAMFDEAVKLHRNIHIPPGRYLIDQTIFVRDFPRQSRVDIQGYGAVLLATKDSELDWILVMQRDKSDFRINMEGLSFRGPKKDGTNGLQLLGITYSSFSNMSFHGLDTAFQHAVGWGNRYEGFYFAGNGAKNFLAGSRNMLNGKDNCGGGYNNNQVVNCRVHGGGWKASHSHYEFVDPHQLSFQNNVSEGKHPRHNLIMDFRTDRCAGYNLIDGLWIESQPHDLIPSNSTVYFPVRAFRTELNNVLWRGDTLLRVDAERHGIIEINEFPQDPKGIIWGPTSNLQISQDIPNHKIFTRKELLEFLDVLFPGVDKDPIRLRLIQSGTVFDNCIYRKRGRIRFCD